MAWLASVRDARSGSCSPEKKLKIAIQTEDIAKGSKGVFGRCTVALSALAKDGNVAQLSLPLSDSPFRRPPTLHVTLRTHWETIDGYTLRVVSSSDDTSSPKQERRSGTGSSHKAERRSTFGTSLTHDRADKTSLFPQRKAQIGGITYEMYENDQEEMPDGALSYRSDANASESELDFTCDVSSLSKLFTVITIYAHTNFDVRREMMTHLRRMMSKGSNCVKRKRSPPKQLCYAVLDRVL